MLKNQTSLEFQANLSFSQKQKTLTAVWKKSSKQNKKSWNWIRFALGRTSGFEKTKLNTYFWLVKTLKKNSLKTRMLAELGLFARTWHWLRLWRHSANTKWRHNEEQTVTGENISLFFPPSKLALCIAILWLEFFL